MTLETLYNSIELPDGAPFNDGICYDESDHLFKLWYMPDWFHSGKRSAGLPGLTNQLEILQ